jgi:sugar phosphate isomerase/epimerase
MSQFKLGFVSAILPDLTLEEVFQTAQSIGYQAVELMSWPVGRAERRYAGVTHIDANHFDANEVNDLAAKYGITISGIGYYPNLLSPNVDEAKTAREHLRKVIAASAAIGVNVTNTFVGRNPALTIDDNWPEFLKVWPDLVKYAEDLGVRIGIENCPMYFTKDEFPGGKNLAISPSVWRRMFEAIPSQNFGLNYDPSHLVWQFMDHEAPLTEFADRLHHIHLKDAKIDRAKLNDVGITATPLEFHSPVLPGRGEIDWRSFLLKLATTGYDGPVVVEVEDREFEDSLEGRKEALRQAYNTLQPLIP